MARPKGRFNVKKDECLKIISVLSSKQGCCCTSGYLGKRLGVTPNHIQRYLKALKSEGKIEINTSGLLKDNKTGFRYKRRWIKPTALKTINSSSLLDNVQDLLIEHEKKLDSYRQAFEQEMSLTGGSDLCDSLYQRIMALEGLE